MYQQPTYVSTTHICINNPHTYQQPVCRQSDMTFGPIKAINYLTNVTWANQKSESFLYRWLRESAMFDVRCSPAFFGAYDVIRRHFKRSVNVLIESNISCLIQYKCVLFMYLPGITCGRNLSVLVKTPSFYS